MGSAPDQLDVELVLDLLSHHPLEEAALLAVLRLCTTQLPHLNLSPQSSLHHRRLSLPLHTTASAWLLSKNKTRSCLHAPMCLGSHGTPPKSGSANFVFLPGNPKHAVSSTYCRTLVAPDI